MARMDDYCSSWVDPWQACRADLCGLDEYTLQQMPAHPNGEMGHLLPSKSEPGARPDPWRLLGSGRFQPQEGFKEAHIAGRPDGRPMPDLDESALAAFWSGVGDGSDA